MTPIQGFTARLTGSISLSAQVRHLEFEMKGLDHFSFIAGQWLSFKHRKPDGGDITRVYSIASPPGSDNRFALCLNRVEDGFMSNFLCDMKEGDVIACQGPSGDFTLHPPSQDTIFIATSTGIAAFRSMLHWLLAERSRHQDHRFWLLFGNRYESDIYYHGEFLELAAKHPNFRYLPTLSRGGPDWQGLRGYVQEHIARIAQGRTDMRAYISGLDKMIETNCNLLQELGWERKSILYEKYD
jgi:ferredoxin-NADP reductase